MRRSNARLRFRKPSRGKSSVRRIKSLPWSTAARWINSNLRLRPWSQARKTLLRKLRPP